MPAVFAFLLLAASLAGCSGEGGDPNPSEGYDDAVPHCVGECGRIVDGSPARAWEPFVAVDPEDSDRIVIAHSEFPDGSTVGRTRISISDNGGASWDTRVVPSGFDEGPTHPLAPYRHVGLQPILVFLPDGTLVMSALATNFLAVPDSTAHVQSAHTLYTSRSTDGGRTWGDVRIMDEGEGVLVLDSIDRGVGQSAFRGRLATGPGGTLFLFWTQFARIHPDNDFRPERGGRLVFASSDDGGLTWSSAGIVDDEGWGYGASAVFGADGVWRVVYIDLEAETLRFAESSNLGATWTARTIGPAYLKAAMREQTLASGIERLLIAYPTHEPHKPGEYRTQFIWSDDGGATWTPPLALDTLDGAGTPMLNVAAGPADSAWVTFMDVDGSNSGEHSMYLAVKVVDGVASQPLVLDDIDTTDANAVMTVHLGYSVGLDVTPDGDAIAAWVTFNDGEYDLVWARITGGDRPVARPVIVVPTPAGLDERVEYEFTGHVNFPGCYAESDPALDAVVRDRVEFEFEVPAGTRFVNATLDWEMQQPVADLDLYLYDPDGDLFRGADEVPERFSFDIEESDQGMWTALVQNCENAPTDFTLEIVLA